MVFAALFSLLMLDAVGGWVDGWWLGGWVGGWVGVWVGRSVGGSFSRVGRIGLFFLTADGNCVR